MLERETHTHTLSHIHSRLFLSEPKCETFLQNCVRLLFAKLTFYFLPLFDFFPWKILSSVFLLSTSPSYQKRRVNTRIHGLTNVTLLRYDSHRLLIFLFDSSSVSNFMKGGQILLCDVIYGWPLYSVHKSREPDFLDIWTSFMIHVWSGGHVAKYVLSLSNTHTHTLSLSLLQVGGKYYVAPG